MAIGSLTSPGILRRDPSLLAADVTRLPGAEGSRVRWSFQWSTAALANGDGRRAVLLGTDGQDTNEVGLQLGTSGLKSLAEDSGGRMLELDRDADLLLSWQSITTELRHQYLLSFPATERDGKLHRIEVKVKRRDVRVRARRTDRAAATEPWTF